MRILKPQGIEINIDELPRKIMFDLNVNDEIQDRYDEPVHDIMSKIFGETKEERKQSYKLLRCVITILINEDVALHNKYNSSEGIWDFVTELYVGSKINEGNIGAVSDVLWRAYMAQFPKVSEDEQSPNVRSGLTR